MIRIDQSGWMEGVLQIPSPNFDTRPAGVAIDLLVVHSIALPPGRFGGEGISRLFTNALDPQGHEYYNSIYTLRVSSHVLIRRDGRLIQYVPFGARAWHAGVSSWRGRERCNDFSIGVELEGTDHSPFAGAQYESLQRLLEALDNCYPIREIVGHSDVAPGRKSDPGRCFDWMLLASVAQGRIGCLKK